MGTTEHQLYDALDSILAEGWEEVSKDRVIMGRIRADIDARMYGFYRPRSGEFTPMMRLTWATARYGTDEELAFLGLCPARRLWRTETEFARTSTSCS